MKPIDQLTNIDRAKLMHQLFPGEIKDFLTFGLALSAKVINSADELRNDWKHGFITADFWVMLAGKVHERINLHAKRLEHNSQLFADQLFEGYIAFFSADAVTKYARFSKDRKFKAATEMLFGPESGNDDYTDVIYQLCMTYSHDYLFDAINESMRQREKPLIKAEAREYLSHSALATLATTIIIQTDKLDDDGHFIDDEGKFKVSDL